MVEKSKCAKWERWPIFNKKQQIRWELRGRESVVINFQGRPAITFAVRQRFPSSILSHQSHACPLPLSIITTTAATFIYTSPFFIWVHMHYRSSTFHFIYFFNHTSTLHAATTVMHVSKIVSDPYLCLALHFNCLLFLFIYLRPKVKKSNFECVPVLFSFTSIAVPQRDDQGAMTPKRVIILYSRSVLNVYFFLLQKSWISLIKFIVGPTTSVRGGSTHYTPEILYNFPPKS